MPLGPYQGAPIIIVAFPSDWKCYCIFEHCLEHQNTPRFCTDEALCCGKVGPTQALFVSAPGYFFW